MLREEPFNVRRGKRSRREWAEKILRLWMEDGYPELLGRAAEQVSLARSITAWQDRRKPTTGNKS